MKKAIIQQTNDYSQFGTITGNRNVSLKKIAKISSDIANGFNMLPYCPIIVSEKPDGGGYHIIDGQHRFEVSKSTENPVYYVICDTLSLKQIALLNSRAEKWKAHDFLNCYINQGIKDYEMLRDILKEYGFNIRIVTDLLMFGQARANSASNATEIFQNGDFKCKYPDQTKHLLGLMITIFGNYAFSKDRNLVVAVQTLLKNGKCDFERLQEKLKQAPNQLTQQASPKTYLNCIEQVYNYKDSIRRTIF